MHELSIANDLVELVEAELVRAGAARATRVTVRLGAWCGVVPQLLRSAFAPAVAGTRLQGAALVLEVVPAVIWCENCDAEQALHPAVYIMRCPRCGQRAGPLIRGRELEVACVEVLDAAANFGSSPEGVEEQ